MLTRSAKPNYVQNGKVHFKRLGHLNEELEFRRNSVPPQLPTLLSKKELLSRLSKRNDHQEQIPDNAAEIVDNPEQEYNDYKDAVSQFFSNSNLRNSSVWPISLVIKKIHTFFDLVAAPLNLNQF
ncbi:unnamed protein product [Cercopithifilaria johnstoni]|uniref:Uncharacterized protein n=1 Tax=Cercopithifilaria johnstoni TaxID=2874296 RepID=A0A8J2QA53_9BILA|nr:unnamed protein product [Cercopithifilaria johnstoni]